MKKEYNLCEEVCKKEGCYCPPSHEFHSTIANTPLWLRAYLKKTGYYQALDEYHILYGEDAKRFIKNMNRKPSKKVMKFLEECGAIYKQTYHKEKKC